MSRTLIALSAAAALAVVPATGASASTKLHVFFPKDCQHNAYKPKSIVVTCADANFLVKRISWKSYGSKTAHGTGTASVNTCDPSCVAGKFKSYPVRVALSRVRQCGDVPQFTRLRVTFTHRRPKGMDRVETQKFACAIPPTR